MHTEQGRLPFFSLLRTNISYPQLGTDFIQIANAEVDVELVSQNLLEQVAGCVWSLLAIADHLLADRFPDLVDMAMPLIIQSRFPFHLHAPLPSIGRRTADRQTHAGNSFLPGLFLVHGSNHPCFCVTALLTSESWAGSQDPP